MPPVQSKRRKDRLEAVYRAHHDFVWRSVRRLGVEVGSVDDVVHEVFIVVSRRLEEFEGRSNLQTWLFAIAMRVVKNHRRTQWRHDRRVEASGERYEGRDGTSDPSGGADGQARSEAAMTLHRMLAELSDDQRAAYILGELNGHSAPEIAEALDTNVNTIYARIRSARTLMNAAAERIRSEWEPSDDG